MIALDKNPPVTFPPDLRFGESTHTWWVAQTRSRHEKALAFDLIMWEIPFFLPMVERTHCVGRRRFRALLPLFPGYLFFSGDGDAQWHALATKHVVNTISVIDQQRLVDELTQIESALAARTPMDPYPYLKEGRLCQVRSGALRGIRGRVIRRCGVTRLVLQVDMLGQAVATEIDPALVEPID